MGHAESRAVVRYFQTAHRLFLKRTAGRTPTVADFEDALFDLRFQSRPYGVPRKVRSMGVGFPHQNTPDLSGDTLYTVMKLQWLHGLVDRASPLKTQIDLPINCPPADEAGFLDDWNSLADSERHFSLAGFLGNPIVWFTDQAGVDMAERFGRDHGLDRADSYCEALGLGHHKQGEWLVLLKVPGNAVQEAGHYRPLFCDAVMHRWFMARSANDVPPPPEWGQTANIHALLRGVAEYDGPRERVARQIVPAHASTARIEVELLGKLSRSSHPDDAPNALVAGVWARRREK